MSEAKTLHLTLKKKWFDMILRGEKKEEYREIKKYWAVRLCGSSQYKTKIEDALLPNDKSTHWNHFYPVMFKEYNQIEFKHGYAKNAPTMTVECRGIEIGRTKGEWADNAEQKVFVIKLGNVLFHKNCN